MFKKIIIIGTNLLINNGTELFARESHLAGFLSSKKPFFIENAKTLQYLLLLS